MQKLGNLAERITRRIGVNLKRFDFDAGPYLRGCVPIPQLFKFYAFYGVTALHPIHFHFSNSNLAGSYFLGKCKVDNSILYKTDVRGDELKSKGESIQYRGTQLVLEQDELISVTDSFLIKTLVHNRSHDPENPEVFVIKNSAACPYCNIHGAPLEGCFLGAFATVDLTALHGCIVGPYAYVQAGELWHRKIDPGHIWITRENSFDFSYRFPEAVLSRYIRFEPGSPPRGLFMEFLEARKEDFRRVYDVVHLEPPIKTPRSTSLSRYAVIKPKARIGANVLIAQRAYLEDSFLGRGSNAQENCFIINSHLQGHNVTAHGAKIINARLEEKVFVGFNSFLRGMADAKLAIGKASIIMPHTIIDLEEPVAIPPGHLVWGHITRAKDLNDHSLPIKTLAKNSGRLSIGNMEFQGSGSQFTAAFQNRIEHILEANGAYFDGRRNKGHAQKGQSISYNIIQPYPVGVQKGIYPTIEIQP
jgi:carbonic anhydrase/acetyltransferase-like protein (isoleucine patch superfamily)